MENEDMYLNLPDEAKKEYQRLIDDAKYKIKEVAEDAISEIYCDVATHIETDSWTNFRNTLIKGIKGYPSYLKYDFKKIREEILKENREEIIKDLNKDLLEEVESLKNELKIAYRSNY